MRRLDRLAMLVLSSGLAIGAGAAVSSAQAPIPVLDDRMSGAELSDGELDAVVAGVGGALHAIMADGVQSALIGREAGRVPVEINRIDATEEAQLVATARAAAAAFGPPNLGERALDLVVESQLDLSRSVPDLPIRLGREASGCSFRAALHAPGPSR